jgi:hypothetical protein
MTDGKARLPHWPCFRIGKREHGFDASPQVELLRTSSPSGIRRRARYPAQTSSAHACFGHLLVAARAARHSAAYRTMPSAPSRVRDFSDVPEDLAPVVGAARGGHRE